MLIEFSVTNYRSILERQTLSLVASTYFKELETLNIIPEQSTNGPSLLRSAVLYGPNASGKSTLVKALKFVEKQIFFHKKKAKPEMKLMLFLLS